MLAAVDRVVFSTECVTIGAFRCAASHPSFRNSGPIRDDCFVFPRTTVVIQHDNAPRICRGPDRGHAVQPAAAYERRRVCADGDRCDWFAVSHDLLRAALAGSRSVGRGGRAPDPVHARAGRRVHLPRTTPAVHRRVGSRRRRCARRRGARRRPARSRADPGVRRPATRRARARASRLPASWQTPRRPGLRRAWRSA